MKKTGLSRRFSLILLAFGLTLSLLSCSGGGAPPVSIQAPVGSLIAAAPPDANGNVTITGQPGAVLANATVIAANPPAGIVRHFRWQDLLLKVAIAGIIEVTTTADSAGAFSLVIAASACDDIGIRQVVGEDSSAETIITVPGTSCGGGSCSPISAPPGSVGFCGACSDSAQCASGTSCFSCQCQLFDGECV